MAHEFKVTFFFNSQITGWSESYYNSAAGYENVAGLARSLAVERMRLCGGEVDLVAIRVSDVSVRGDAYFDPLPGFTTRFSGPFNGLVKVVPAELTPTDVSWTALIVNIVADKITRGRIFMRGLPDQFFINARTFAPSTTWKTAFASFAAEYNAAVNSWGVIRKLPSTVLNTFKIRSANATLGVSLALTMKAGFAAAAGQTVAVRGLKSDQGTLSGNFEVIDWNVPVLAIDKTFVNPQPVFKANTGTVQIVDTSFLRELTLYRGVATERKAGRPFGALVGRRKRPLALR